MFFFGKSDIGKRRATNQDDFYAAVLCRNAILCVVCDGMGGAKGGNVASSLAISVFTGYVTEQCSAMIGAEDGIFRPGEANVTEILEAAALEANRAVYACAQRDDTLSGMGTTLIAALFVDKTLYIANIGDSRLYILTGNKMTQITRDHSFVQYLVDMGTLTPEEAAVSPQKNIITRAVGDKYDVETDTFTVNLDELGQCYILLCSDGLTNYLIEDDICEAVLGDNTGAAERDAVAAELEEKITLLINSANDNGGGDNITAVLVKYIDEKTPSEGASDNGGQA